MKVTIDIDEKVLLNDVLENLPEASISLQCTSWNYKECKFTFVDYEDGGKKYTLTYDMAVKGLQLLIEAIVSGKLKGLRHLMEDITDGGNWDADAVDALVQMAIFGDVIYG